MVVQTEAIIANAMGLMINVGIFVAIILIGLLTGYLIGALIAAIVKRILNIRELKEQIASSEILSLAFWGRLVSGTSVYIKWLFVAIGLRSAVEWAVRSRLGNSEMFEVLSGYSHGFQMLMVDLGILLIFGVVGIVLGAVVYKIIKAALDSIRVEERMAKHGLHEALGGLQLTKVISGIFMIYVIIVLLGSGLDAVAARSGDGFDEIRLVVMFRSLVNIYPEFVLGGIIIIAGALSGDFIRERVKKSKDALASESLAFLLYGMVIFFAIVLALPHFQIRENVDILTDSFKIVVAGLSIGLAIAMGLGLKDVFSHWGKKMEKKL